MVSGLRHVSLCCCVGRGPGTLPGVVGNCSVGSPMRKFSCALPRGSAVVAERQGEGSEWLDHAQPHFGAGAACSHPGMLWGLCKQDLHGVGVLMPCSVPVQSRLDRTVNLINNGKSSWLLRCLLRERSLFRHIQPLARPLAASFLLHFPPWWPRGWEQREPLPASSLSFLKAPCLLL